MTTHGRPVKKLESTLFRNQPYSGESQLLLDNGPFRSLHCNQDIHPFTVQQSDDTMSETGKYVAYMDFLFCTITQLENLDR